MAKKILAEKFSINSIDLEKDSGTSKLKFNSLLQANSTDIDSLDTRVSQEEKARSTDRATVTSNLNAEISTRGAVVTSLDDRVASEESTRLEKVNSLDSRLDSEEATTKIMLGNEIGNNQASLTLDISGEGFADGDDPVVVGMLRSTNASDPILGCMLNGDADHQSVEFVFSDETPSANYVLDVILTR